VEGALAAYDADTGRPERSRPVNGGLLGGGFRGDQGIVVAVARNGDVDGVDAQTGRGVWSIRGSEVPRKRGVIEGDNVVLLSDDLGITAFDRKTGARLWDESFRDSGLDAVSAQASTVFAELPDQSGGDGFSLEAVDSRTGVRRWQTTIDHVDFALDPVAGDGVVAVSVSRKATDQQPSVASVVAFDLASGDLLWRRDRNGVEPALDAIELADGNLYTEPVDDRTRLQALDPRTGTVRWETTVPSSTEVVGGSGLPLPTTEGRVTAFDATAGSQRWTGAGGSGLLLLTTTDGRVTALDATTGSQRWTSAVPKGSADAIAVDGTVYVSILGKPTKCG